MIEEGTLSVETTGADVDNVNVGGLMTVSGGTVEMKVAGLDSKGIKASNLSLLGGTIKINASGDASKCIKVDTTLIIGNADGTGPVITATTTGSSYSANVNSRTDTDGLLTGPGGGPGGGGGWGPGGGGGGWGPGGGQGEDSGSSAKAIKCMGAIYMYGGELTISTKTDGAEGLESKTNMYLNGGTIIANCYDDCINAKGIISCGGANIYCYSNGNDAIDSNYGRSGAITISGGVVIAVTSKGSPEEGLDCDNNSYISLKGGEVFTGGGVQSNASATLSAPQGYYWNTSGTYSNYVSLQTSSGSTIFTVKIPTSISNKCSLISSASMSSNGSYKLVRSSSAPTGYTDTFGDVFYKGGSVSNTSSVTSFTAK